MQKNKFYVTTPIYYPSSNLHIGHTYCTVAADTIARYKRAQGYDVKFLTGTDEHGQKIENVAKEKGMDTKEYLDGMIAQIKDLWEVMDISNDGFIRTTDEDHKRRVQMIFQKLYDKGEIYKSEYEGEYCTPCESFWTSSQLKDGKCPDCEREVTKMKEEAYFFRLSKYADRLIELYEREGGFLEPRSRVNEMVNNFIKPGLEDLCITRTSFKWGIPVPFDEKHVIYVWLDALSNYITHLGYPENESDENGDFKKYWPANIQLVGKEIVRFHTIIWPAMLMALDIPVPKKVFGHGWILLEGGKMSKSKGNVVDPVVLRDRYGVDAIRYFLLREYSFGSDGVFSNEALLNRINSDLANDLGNIVSRSIAMVEKYQGGRLIKPANLQVDEYDKSLREMALQVQGKLEESMEKLDFSKGLEEIWKLISRANKYIDETAPWVLAKDEANKERLSVVLYNLCEVIRIVAILIKPFMNRASEAIFAQLGIIGEINSHYSNWKSAGEIDILADGQMVRKGDNLFPRIDVKKELLELTGDGASEETNEKAEKKEKPKKDKKSESKADGEKSQILYDDFAKVDLRVAKIIKAEKHPDADKLLVLLLKVGDEEIQVVSGIAKHYTPEELVGKTVIHVYNLKPAKLRGIESRGMILAATINDELSLVGVDMQDGAIVS